MPNERGLGNNLSLILNYFQVIKNYAIAFIKFLMWKYFYVFQMTIQSRVKNSVIHFNNMLINMKYIFLRIGLEDFH